MKYSGHLLILLAAAALLGYGLWGCAPPPPVKTELTPEQKQAIADSLAKAKEIELAKKYSFAFENYKTARTTENPQYKELYYRAAIGYFWQVAELDTSNKYNIYGKLADCYTQLDKGDSAVIVLELGLKKFPTDTYLNQSLGYIAKSRGEYDTALQRYLVALGNEPDNPDFLKTVGELYQKVGNVDKAIETYQKYLAVMPNDRSIQEKVTELYRVGRPPEEYLQELINFIKTNPEDIQKRFDLASFYMDNADNEKAIIQYQAILKIDPKNVEAMEKLAQADENLRKYQDAITTYDKILAIDPTRKNIFCSEALDYVELNDYAQARQKAERALALDRNYGRAWNVMGRIYMSNADDCSRGREVNYFDKLTYLVAYGLFKHAKEVGDYDAQAEADRWINYLSGSELIPQKGDWFLHKADKRPQGDCYAWMNPSWNEMNYIEPYLARFE
jgi:tetratricopeptide (TPR) repeat protein